MDVTDDSATVPVHNNCVTIKASRLSSGQSGQAPRAQPTRTKAAAEQPEKKRNPSVKLINFDDGDSHSSAPAAPGKIPILNRYDMCVLLLSLY